MPTYVIGHSHHAAMQYLASLSSGFGAIAAAIEDLGEQLREMMEMARADFRPAPRSVAAGRATGRAMRILPGITPKIRAQVLGAWTSSAAEPSQFASRVFAKPRGNMKGHNEPRGCAARPTRLVASCRSPKQGV